MPRTWCTLEVVESVSVGLVSASAGDEAVLAEAARLAAVRRYDILDTPPDGAFDRIAATAAQLLDMPIASVTIVDADRIWFKAAHGLDGVTQLGRDPGRCASAILSDEPYLVTDAAADPVAAGNPLVRGVAGVRFYAGAPITTSEGHRLGTVNVIDTRPRHLDATGRAVLQSLAALVMDQLELRLSAMTTLRRERELREQAERDTATIEAFASTLQRTLLPPTLPRVPGVELACHYHAASPRDVGGDFYDVFSLGDGRWGFFLGDVEGHGAAAAAVTSLSRYTLRAAALHDADPAAVLAELNTTLRLDRDTQKCVTVLFGVLTAHPAGGAMITLGNGGHQPALVLRADTGAAGDHGAVPGSVREVALVGGQLLGALAEPDFVTASLHLQPGDTLLLYTDGLTDARPNGEPFGEDGLVQFLADRTAKTAGDLVTDLATLISGFDAAHTDDVALLALTAQHTRP